MNYSKDSRDKIEKKNKSKTRQIKKKGKVTVFRIIIISLIIGMFAVVGAGLGIFIGIIKSTPDPSTLDISPQGNYTSIVYDSQGHQIDSFEPAENREYVELKDIPLNLQHAVVATEDERFYQHNGIDIRGIFRALVKNIKTGSFSEGASTITQQLIKNNILDSDKALTRKIQEQYLAIEFEKLYSKDTILEYYLNTIGLGQGVSGVRAASKRYFGKDVQDLTLTECVVIAVITQRPTYYNPISNPENNWEKVKVVLQKMEDQGYITAEEHAAALKEDPYENISVVHEEYLGRPPHSYFVDALFNQLVSDLKDLGYTEATAKKMIYGGGLEITSTMDKNMQDIADKYIGDDSLYPAHLYKIQLDYSVSGKKADGTKFEHQVYNIIVNNEQEVESFKQKQLEEWGITSADTYTENLIQQPQPQASFVLMDYKTGQVKALSGGRGQKSNLSFNYATQAKRQPGSTFKILAAYAPALDMGKLSPGSEMVNEHISYPLADGTTWSPKNWDNNYEGTYTVRQAIANSMNVIAVKTAVDYVGIDNAFDYLKSFGFTTLTDTDRVLSLPLGGLTQGVTPLELNAAYGAIANDGVYVKPVFYTQVKDREGHILIDNTNEAITLHSHTVIKQSTARMLTNMMQEVIDGPNPHTGGRVRANFKNMPIAGKTGTTSDDKDYVFAGYTPYYVATIWSGYSQPAPINNGGSYHLVIWGKIMSEIHENLEYKSFPKVDIDNSGVSEIKICTVSGKRATALCEADPNHVVKRELFTAAQKPTEYCDLHVEVEICTESKKIANEYCPVDKRVKEPHVRKVVDGVIVQDEVCDIHGPDNTETVPGEPTDIPGVDPFPNPYPNTPGDGFEGDGTTPTPSPTPVIPSPTLPPIVDPSPTPGVDDEDGFFFPQG